MTTTQTDRARGQRRGPAALALLTALAVTVSGAASAQGDGSSLAAEQCRLDGWQQVMGADGTTFANTGLCVAYAARGGQLVPRNGAPVAVDDSHTLGANLPGVIHVLANDTDPEDDPLSVDIVTAPAHGVATASPDGTVTYVPATGFSGEDRFSYRVSDGHGGADTATVTLTVVPAPIDIVAVSPSLIHNDITIQISLIVTALPPTHVVTSVTFTRDGPVTSLAPDPMSIPTRIQVTLPRLALAPGTYDVRAVTSDGHHTTAAVLVDGLQVVGPG